MTMARISSTTPYARALLFLLLFQFPFYPSAFLLTRAFWSTAGSPSQFAFHSLPILSAPSTRLKVLYRSRIDETGAVSLEHFLSTCSEWNRKLDGSVRIISRGTAALPHQAIATSIFVSPNSEPASYIVTILRKGDAVDYSKLQEIASEEVHLVAQDRIHSLFGFAVDTIPPFGHLESPRMKLLIDKSLVEQCRAENQMMLGAAGHPYWQCLLSTETLLTFSNAQVASLSADTANTEMDENESPLATKNPDSNSVESSRAFKPFFAANTPPHHIAQILVEQRDLSNPLKQTSIKAIGLLGSVERKTKKQITAYLLPHYVDSEESKKDPRPWKCATSGEDMAVHLIFGKNLFQALGIAHGEAAIENINEGQLIEITAQTRVSSRDSLSRWVERRCLDLEIKAYRILSEKSKDSSGGRAFASDSQLLKHKPPVASTSPQLPVLTLRDVFADSGQVVVVDTTETLQSFAHDSLELLSNLNKSKESQQATLVGIDCEWQPNQLSPDGQTQPVLLLQISFHSLGTVYLLDLQTLLRPLLSSDEEMNETETMTSESLDFLFRSKRVIKVGYQVASDLRRIAASYPHVSCFQDIQAVLEVDTLVKRILHLTKQKKSRSITMSLARLTAHYVEKSICKECQVSDWSARPLTPDQKGYAALDAAIGPLVAEKAMETVNATINGGVPRIERWDGDMGVSKAINSWRFLFLQTEDLNAIKKLQAKQIVGPFWIVTQSWITGGRQPRFPSVPSPSAETPYTDNNGVLRIPARMLQIHQPGDGALFAGLVGTEVGKSKDHCLGMLLSRAAALPGGARIDFPRRLSYVEFDDAIALFLTLPGKCRPGESRNFPGMFLEDGQVLSWFISSRVWNEGRSDLATKLLGSRNEGDDYLPLVLFVRNGNGNFISCGRCRVLLPEEVPRVTDTNKPKGYGLTQLDLELLDFEALTASEIFTDLISPLMSQSSWTTIGSA